MSKNIECVPLTFDITYSPIEQKQHKKIYPQSDVYSLGKVLRYVQERNNIEIGTELKEILNNMIEEDYKKRFSVSSIIEKILRFCKNNNIVLSEEFSDSQMTSPFPCKNFHQIQKTIEKEKMRKQFSNEDNKKTNLKEKELIIEQKEIENKKMHSIIEQQNQILKEKESVIIQKEIEISKIQQELEEKKKELEKLIERIKENY